MGTPACSAIERIRTLSSELTPKQRQLVTFILQYLEKSAFMNSVDLARASGVSNATVIRLASRLGYDGFPGLQKDLQQNLRDQYSTLRRFPLDHGDINTSLIKKVLSLEYEVLDEMQGKISEADIISAVHLLRNCEQLYIIGLHANTCLAEYAAYFLGILRSHVNLITSPRHSNFNFLKDCNPKSAALVYSFPRYPAETQDMVRYLSQKGTKIIGITDSSLSPLAPLCHILFEVPMKFITFIDPCAGAFALSHCLLSSFYFQDLPMARKRLGDFESFAGNRNYFERKDIDIVDLI